MKSIRDSLGKIKSYGIRLKNRRIASALLGFSLIFVRGPDQTVSVNNVEDVFSTYLYTGNGSTQTITNGINLSTNGGLVWIKRRAEIAWHALYDTVRGDYELATNVTDQQYSGGGIQLTSYLSSGFSLGSSSEVNGNAITYSSWTFRKAAKFFDVVTYTGNGVAGRTVNHNLGSLPGMLIVKRTDTTGNWEVFHRASQATYNSSADYALQLNLTNAAATSSVWNSGTPPTATNFTVSDGATVNANGGTYVAYLFAHDTSATGLIQCGSVTTDGSGNATVTLGWEPQFMLFKQSNAVDNWYTVDTMRGATDSAHQNLFPNLSNAEAAAGALPPTATGFKLVSVGNSTTWIYLAIRRGPMSQPTVGTQVFDVDTYSGNSGTQTITSGFPVDSTWIYRRGGTYAGGIYDRLRGGGSLKELLTSSTAAEGISGAWDSVNLDNNTGTKLVATSQYAAFNETGGNYVNYAFRRYPGVFDVVCYTGDGQTTKTVSHNLTVVPEMVVLKRRDAIGNWWARTDALTSIDYYLELSTTAAQTSGGGTSLWGNTAPTATAFTVGNGSSVNTNGATHVAYLFATKAGISKVGSYTGNGSNQTINCGFSAGARFILIKRTDSTGDWFVWDSTRGIVAADDPHLSLNTTAAEVTNDDSIDPDNSGFIANQLSATNVNVNGATYIFLAIA